MTHDIKVSAKKIKDMQDLINQSIHDLKRVLKSRGLDVDVVVSVVDGKVVLSSELDLVFQFNNPTNE